jgi:N-acyl-D-aspartate/D-glutamate deacylase
MRVPLSGWIIIAVVICGLTGFVTNLHLGAQRAADVADMPTDARSALYTRDVLASFGLTPGPRGYVLSAVDYSKRNQRSIVLTSTTSQSRITVIDFYGPRRDFARVEVDGSGWSTATGENACTHSPSQTEFVGHGVATVVVSDCNIDGQMVQQEIATIVPDDVRGHLMLVHAIGGESGDTAFNVVLHGLSPTRYSVPRPAGIHLDSH